MNSPDWPGIREQFPALRDKTFLDAACVSLAPRAATEAISRFLDMALQCPAASSTLHHIAMDEMRNAARGEAARLLNAREEEIALVESTSHGLNLAATTIPLEPGDRVLLSDLEFMQVALPWIQLAPRGIGMDVVPHRNGEVLAESFAERATPKTKVIAVSSVQWSHGYRCDLAAFSAFCRERGIWLVVDATQQLGAIPMDVRKTPADFVACGGHKWLNSPFGAGFLYVRKESQTKLHPPLTGYLSVEPPAGGWGEYFQTPSITPVQDYRFCGEARRLETGGTSNYPGNVGLAASLALIHEIGMGQIGGRVLELTDYLLAGLRTLKVEVVTPTARENRSGIVTFSAGTPARNTALMERLLERKILVSVRYTSQVGGVRVSTHFFNSQEDLDILLNAVEDLLPKL
jgi:cysteine desulfurase/selenocysteine lyase